MINIHSNFIGGNIKVKEISGDTVVLENELRDTEGDWFYWAFCVEGAKGRTLTFKMQQTRIGYWGPAVSHDLAEWSWLDSCTENSFTYSFGKDESRVYFSRMRQLQEKLAAQGYPRAMPDILSMGMSGSYYEAILEGSNLVRIGTAIYGARDYGNKI